MVISSPSSNPSIGVKIPALLGIDISKRISVEFKLLTISSNKGKEIKIEHEKNHNNQVMVLLYNYSLNISHSTSPASPES